MAADLQAAGGTATPGRPRSPRSPLSRSGGRGGGSRARRPPRRAGTSRCRSRWAERTHTHTQTGRARASGDRAGRAGGAQLPPPPLPPPLLVLPLVLMLRALRQRRAAQGCSAKASEGTQLAAHCKVAACHFLIIRLSSPGIVCFVCLSTSIDLSGRLCGPSSRQGPSDSCKLLSQAASPRRGARETSESIV
ncbi:uncharacterized protein LOC143434186 [Arvicanthis niloticus]|uniref:uncharacterized protein LOC143434186 n=1 Tax=Arvicanthis niloticus TaxID=61156 RepID=UPI00403C8974